MSVLLGWALAGHGTLPDGVWANPQHGASALWAAAPMHEKRQRLALMHRLFEALDPFLPNADASQSAAGPRVDLPDLLNRMTGLCQVSVDLRCPPAEAPASADTGRAFLMSRYRAHTAQAERRTRVSRWLTELTATLPATARRVLNTPEGGQAHVLVPRAQGADLVRQLTHAAEAATPHAPAGRMVITGPWPPSVAVWAGDDG